MESLLASTGHGGLFDSNDASLQSKENQLSQPLSAAPGLTPLHLCASQERTFVSKLGLSSAKIPITINTQIPLRLRLCNRNHGECQNHYKHHNWRKDTNGREVQCTY